MREMNLMEHERTIRPWCECFPLMSQQRFSEFWTEKNYNIFLDPLYKQSVRIGIQSLPANAMICARYWRAGRDMLFSVDKNYH